MKKAIIGLAALLIAASCSENSIETAVEPRVPSAIEHIQTDEAKEPYVMLYGGEPLDLRTALSTNQASSKPLQVQFHKGNFAVMENYDVWKVTAILARGRRAMSTTIAKIEKGKPTLHTIDPKIFEDARPGDRIVFSITPASFDGEEEAMEEVYVLPLN